MVIAAPDLERARAIAGSVPDPELPMLTLEDLGILRDVSLAENGTVVVELTPTYSGCPALEVMRRDVARRLDEAGFAGATVRTVLGPAWTSDWVTPRGRRALADAGIAPPGAAPTGPTLLSLEPPPRVVACPRCGASGTVELSAFGATACRALWRCTACGEPFERFKEL
jgi:ring-1,2-phenylacetyl-CoA epoxidase subunit PaaD